MADSGTPPDRIGDLAQFLITFTAPSTAPGATVAAMTVDVVKPDGSVIDNDGVCSQVTPNVWSYVGTDPIDTAGRWTWVATATGALRDTRETEVVIPPSRRHP